MKESEANRAFTSVSLRMVREDAKKAGVHVPKLRTWAQRGGVNVYYEVHGPAGCLWEGNADNASDAKTKCIEKLIEQHENEKSKVQS